MEKEFNWDTDELLNHILNDEWLYTNVPRRCYGYQLRAWIEDNFDYRDAGIVLSRVHWGKAVRFLCEEREETKKEEQIDSKP